MLTISEQKCAIHWQYYDTKFSQYIPIYHRANISLSLIVKQLIWCKTISEIPKKMPSCQVCSGKQSHEQVDRKQMKKTKAPNQVGLVADEF